MLDFRRKSKPAPLSDYRERRKWLVLVVGVGMLLILVAREIERPRITKWLLGIPDAEGPEQIDTRLNLHRAPEPPVDQIAIPLAQAEPADLPNADQYYPGLETSLLSTIEDGTVQSRPGEGKVFFHLFDLLNQTKPGELETFLEAHDAATPVGFRQLFQQSEHYRGKVVRVHAVARGVFPRPLRKNAYGLEKYYQVWLQTQDRNVIVAFVLDVPENFPYSETIEGDDFERVNEEVEIVGFFYKRMAYKAHDGLRSAPLVLAKELKWYPRKVASSEPWSWATIFSVVGGGALLGIVMAYWLFTSARAEEPRSEPTSRDIAALQQIQADPEVGEQLAEMARQSEDAGPDHSESEPAGDAESEESK